MSTGLNTVAAQDLKRRGVIAIEERLVAGPVHIIKRNRPLCVVLSETDYRELVEEASASRLAASLADVREGRVKAATAREIVDEALR
jgi:PHD/YefM family antitoxin component YafN of YafNO toxin-antitoxin module